jgi:hypothetical protein
MQDLLEDNVLSKDNFMDSVKKAIQNVIDNYIEQGLTLDDIDKRIAKINFSELISDFTTQVAKDNVVYIKSAMYERILEERADTAEFMARQEQKWGKCFVASESMYFMAIGAAEEYCEFVKSNINKKDKKANRYTFVSLQHIHGRACQQYLEILYLMKHGFADGAYARWRSMYELSCIAVFIREYGEGVAKAYVGDSNSDNPWHDWAKEAQCFNGIKKKHIKFSDIQDKCTIPSKEWKAQYQLANKIVHASPQGTFNRLSSSGKTKVISAGHSDYGITTPAEHSAISLAIISSTFFTLFPSGDAVIRVKSINEWIDVIRDLYFSTSDKIFGEGKSMTQNNADPRTED